MWWHIDKEKLYMFVYCLPKFIQPFYLSFLLLCYDKKSPIVPTSLEKQQVSRIHNKLIWFLREWCIFRYGEGRNLCHKIEIGKHRYFELSSHRVNFKHFLLSILMFKSGSKAYTEASQKTLSTKMIPKKGNVSKGQWEFQRNIRLGRHTNFCVEPLEESERHSQVFDKN